MFDDADMPAKKRKQDAPKKTKDKAKKEKAKKRSGGKESSTAKKNRGGESFLLSKATEQKRQK